MSATFAAGLSAAPASADWAANNCSTNGPSTPSSWARENARSYAATAIGDGYDWGGGCWNGNGIDDTPGQNGNHNSVGEGPDCSGLTFKSWAMAWNWSNAHRQWGIREDEHGPYTAASFHNGAGAVNVLANKTYDKTKMMDAFASDSHIGMIYSEGSGGADQIIEAKDQSANTGVFTRNYRSNASYRAVRRQNWSAYCPQCG